jgi:hypothetical protein
VIHCQLLRLKGRHYIHGPGPSGSASGFIVAPERYICANRSDSVRICVSQKVCLTHASQLIDRKKCGRVIEPQTLLTLPEWCHVVGSAKIILREGLLLVGWIGECSVVDLRISMRWSRVVF